ncbi:hypothetical protein CP556_24885 [Natrinema sp. CBA1119]|uniref:hypothetical protein n=1 Tax=Natrinema sp. CBA1119 TaxID=1608465 RepID=UPI000BF7B879|nr:hypothetical protein [Natrinema sp. CBA1119]PGF14244.1 hypothetical protein CP556_24885 [Natrinema sp. CBA1119]
MTSRSDRSVHQTDPDTKLFFWKPAPSTLEQALEAANDDPTRQELVNMLCSLGGLHVHVDGTDEDWRPTTIDIGCVDPTWQCDTATNDLLTLMRRAGWRLESVSFGARKRLTFREVSDSGE